MDFEVKNTLSRTQRLEGQYWQLSEMFWKTVVDSAGTNSKKAKNNLLILAKKIKNKKRKIKELYEYLLGLQEKNSFSNLFFTLIIIFFNHQHQLVSQKIQGL